MELECLRCGHTWTTRTEIEPKTCPSRSCKSPYWKKPLTEYWRKVREANKQKREEKK